MDDDDDEPAVLLSKLKKERKKKIQKEALRRYHLFALSWRYPIN
jgi:hypothetical protein